MLLIEKASKAGATNVGVAESRYEPRTEFFEGSLRISQNHSAIQQRQKRALLNQDMNRALNSLKAH